MHRHRIFRPTLEVLEDRNLLSSDVGLLDVTSADFTVLDIRYSMTGADAPSLTFRAYLSADDQFDGQDLPLLGQHQVTRPEDLTVGLPHQTTMTLAARAPIHEGQRFVIVVADPDNALEPAAWPSRADNALYAVPLFATGQTADRNGNDDSPEAIPSAAGLFTGVILPGTADFARLAAVDLGQVWTPSPRFQFGYTEGEPQPWQRDEDHFAQPTVIPPLTELVRLLRQDLARVPDLWGDAAFSINEAYDSLRHHTVPESLHYEGRALDLDVLGRPSGGVELSRLAGLAWLAGFDWVLLENSHVHASEHAAFATTINQVSLQQSVLNAFQLKRIESRRVTNLLVRILDGFDQTLQEGRVIPALAQLFVFRTEVQAATGRSIRDTGFSQLLLLNIDKLIGRILSSLSSLPSVPAEERPHVVRGTGHFISERDFVAAGMATHLGRFEAAGSAQLSPTDDPTVLRIEGWAINTAANGAQLFEVFLGRLNVLTGTITATVRYVGGTGKFVNARGAAALSAQLFPDGSIEYATEGTIDYGQRDLSAGDAGRSRWWKRGVRKWLR